MFIFLKKMNRVGIVNLTKKLTYCTSPVKAFLMLQTTESIFPVILKFGTVYLLLSLWTDSGTITKSTGFGTLFSEILD